MTFSKPNSGEYMAGSATDACLDSVYVVEFADALMAEWEGASNILEALQIPV
jgi:hypothetical protein